MFPELTGSSPDWPRAARRVGGVCSPAFWASELSVVLGGSPCALFENMFDGRNPAPPGMYKSQKIMR